MDIFYPETCHRGALMDRLGSETSNWSNPELHIDPADLLDSAAEPEVFDLSTIDPGHIIHLIRQLLPNGSQLSSVPSEFRPVGLKSKAAGNVHQGKNGTIQEALQRVERGPISKNGTIHAGQVVENLSSKQGKATDISNTGAALESASTVVPTGDLESEEGSRAANLIQENGKCTQQNGNHIEQNGYHGEDHRELSRKWCRGGGNVSEQNGDAAEYVANGTSRSLENSPGAASDSVGPCHAEGNVGDRSPGTPDVGCAEREVDSDAHQTASVEDHAQEEAGCVLWDLAATESHAEFLVEHRILDVLLAFLSVPHSDRMREICLGVFGNLACHPGPVKAMVATYGLVETIVRQLFVDNVPSLTETCRLLSAGLHSEVTVAWVESIKPDNVLQRIMWMAVNTLDSQLLEKCTELILAMVDSRRDAAFVLLPSLLRLGLPGLLTDLIDCELTAIHEGLSSSRGDAVLDIVLQIAEAISIQDECASQLAASDELFSLSCQVICLSAKDEIGPSGITATVLIANLLTEKSGLIERVANDPIFLGRLLALLPCAGQDPGARNALWSILGRICGCLVSRSLENPPHGPDKMLAVLADGCSLLLDDLDVHQEDDVEEDEDQALAGHDAAASTSRGLQAKQATVDNLKRVMDQWYAAHGGTSALDMLLGRSVRNARSLLRKYVTTSGVPSGSTGRESSGAVQYGDVNSSVLAGTDKLDLLADYGTSQYGKSETLLEK